MGCIGCLISIGQAIYQKAQELKIRKNLRHFDITLIQKCYEISNKFKYVFIVGLDNFIFLDYQNMKIKNEMKFNGTLEVPKFSDSDNSYTLVYGSDTSKTVLKLKITEDKITEISKSSKNDQKKKIEILIILICGSLTMGVHLSIKNQNLRVHLNDLFL